MRAKEFVSEKWSQRYKRSINCANPQGFSQRAHCAGRQKNEDQNKPVSEATYLRIGDVTDKPQAAFKAAQQLGGKVVKTAGGYYKIASLDDPRPALELNQDFYNQQRAMSHEVEQINRELSKIERLWSSERSTIFQELDRLFPDRQYGDKESGRWLDRALWDLNKKYYRTEPYVGLNQRKTELGQQLKALRAQIKKTKDVSEEQLDELSFKGSPCTKDCSGHRAGYEWSQRRGGVDAASWSRSFNNGAAIAASGL